MKKIILITFFVVFTFSVSDCILSILPHKEININNIFHIASILPVRQAISSEPGHNFTDGSTVQNARKMVASLDPSSKVGVGNATTTPAQSTFMVGLLSGSISSPMLHLPTGPSPSPYIALGAEHISIGGWKDAKGYTVNSGLAIQGNPYGNWSLGCVLCVSDGPDDFGSAGLQFPLSGLDPRSGASAVVNGDAATATISILQNHRHVRLALMVASFDAGGATLRVPISPEQMAHIPANAYVGTNVLDTANTQPSLPGSYLDNRYRGQISSITATRINVYGWASQQGSTSNRQVPDGTKLDQVHNPGSNQPMIYIGGSGENETANIFETIDADNIYTQIPSEMSAFEAGIEWDANATNFTPSQPYTRQFFTIVDNCNAPGGGGCIQGTETDASHGFLIQSNQLPVLYQAHGRWWSKEFDGSGAKLYSNGPVGMTIGNQKVMASFETLSQAGSQPSNMFVVSTEKHSTNYGNWRDDELHIGGYTNAISSYGASGFTPNNPMGVIAFNHIPSHASIPLFGSTCILGYGVAEGFCERGDGSVTFAQTVTVNGGERSLFSGTTGGAAFNAITNSFHVSGDYEFCTDCTGPYAKTSGEYIVLNGSTWTGLDGSNFISGSAAQQPMQAPSGVMSGSAGFAGNGNQAKFIGPIAATHYDTTGPSQTLSQTKKKQHFEGDRVWCHNCRNQGQSTGQGTGRWIFFDSQSIWRSDDGRLAIE